MYHHVKKLMYTVRVDQPDPTFGNMLLEQFGGANGELAAAMQYSIQGLNCDDPERKDLLMDIGTEELSHLGDRGYACTAASQAHEVRSRVCRSRSAHRYRGRRRRESVQLAWETRGPRTTSKSPASSTSICAATSPPRRARRSSTSGSSTSPTTPEPTTRCSS